ncbi:MAG: patatin-like phospholipase family protein [Candidatus Woesearchaeota archaeon]
MNENKNPSFGIALSGGGARCAAHIGFLKVVDGKIDVKQLAGASGGAIVSILYSAGKLDELENFLFKIKSSEITAFFKPSNLKDGLFDSSKIEDFIRSFIGDLKLEDLKIPVIIAASDMTHNRPVYFKKGDAAKAVAASCAIPGLFSPVKIGNSYFVDGGLFNNTPSDVLDRNLDFRVLVDAGIKGGIADFLKIFTHNYRKIRRIVGEYRNRLSSDERIKRIQRSMVAKRLVRELGAIALKSQLDETSRNKKRYTLARIIISSLDNFDICDLEQIKKKCDFYIRPNIKIANLSFHKSKLAIVPGEKAGRDFLRQLKQKNIINFS